MCTNLIIAKEACELIYHTQLCVFNLEVSLLFNSVEKENYTKIKSLFTQLKKLETLYEFTTIFD